PVSADFLSRKVPELLAANDLDQSGDLVEGYLRINRELRARTEVRVRAMCRDSAPAPLWQDAFLRLPNSAPLSGFADRRTYVHDGKTIDQQTHLGFDLASLRGSPVPAANAGRVVFAGALGIYGNAVVIDHGLGVFSLYGHLSEVGVQPGAPVGRGDPIGKTGDTGLAAGARATSRRSRRPQGEPPRALPPAAARGARPRATRARLHPAHPRGARGRRLPLPLRRPRRPAHLDRPPAPERGGLPGRRAA